MNYITDYAIYDTVENLNKIYIDYAKIGISSSNGGGPGFGKVPLKLLSLK